MNQWCVVGTQETHVEMHTQCFDLKWCSDYFLPVVISFKELMASSGSFIKNASAADLIQRRQRSEFLCEFFKCYFFMLEWAIDPYSHPLLYSKYQGNPLYGSKGKSCQHALLLCWIVWVYFTIMLYLKLEYDAIMLSFRSCHISMYCFREIQTLSHPY